MNKFTELIKSNLKSVIGVGLIAIAGFSVNALTKKDIAQTTPAEEINTDEVISKPKINRKITNNTVVEPQDTRGYGELIGAYRDRLIQFGSSCQVVASNQTYKLGSEVFLDNRNSLPVVIKIGDTSYSLSAYGYKVVKLNNEGKLMVGCNDYQNVATVVVQK